MITAHQAHRMLTAGEDKATALGVPVKKARTAVLFEATSEVVWEYCKPGAPAQGLELSNGGLAQWKRHTLPWPPATAAGSS
jgi:uncharacterized protein GlcG (DUF336 family)